MNDMQTAFDSLPTSLYRRVTPTMRISALRNPAGWYLVPESVKGARYSCRPHLPAQALRCEGGTSYFAEGGVIGCR